WSTEEAIIPFKLYRSESLRRLFSRFWNRKVNCMAELEGKVAFLTGAGRGVGVGIALALAKAGAAVGLMGRTRETLEETHAKLQALGARSLVCAGDVGVRADVDRAVAEVTS